MEICRKSLRNDIYFIVGKLYSYFHLLKKNKTSQTIIRITVQITPGGTEYESLV